MSGGTTSPVSMARRPQYRMLITISAGAVGQRHRVGMSRDRLGERLRRGDLGIQLDLRIGALVRDRGEEVDEVMSAKRPKMKQSVEMPRPIMVRNWKCQPYEVV